jgi:diguanylate cyclase (GGDEF)-like protein/PAS domain S-box-containing protein
MRVPPFLPEEDARLAALSEYGAEIGSMDAELNRIVDLASNLFEVPIVLVSLVERARQIFTAKTGLDVCETDRNVSFCAHAIGQRDVLVVPDATLDPRFFDNPLVTGEPKIRFYAGAPLISPSGYGLGTLCIIDLRPRNGFSENDRRNLKDLAALVLDKLELRRLDRARRTSQVRFEQIAATSPDGIICADQKGMISFWNQAATRLFGYHTDEIIGKSVDLVLPDQMRQRRAADLTSQPGENAFQWIGRTVELRARHKNGSEFLTELSLSMWRDEDVVSFGSIVRDITERRSNEDRLFRLAHLDSLTDLPNRTVLRNRIMEGARTSTPMSVIVVDLDGFKDVNDTLGHSAGDLLLQQVSTRLLECVRPTDTVARMGGDEFALLLPEVKDAVIAALTADMAIKAVSEPFMLDGQRVNVGASAGVASWPSNSPHVLELLSNADLALYQAKAEGRHCRRIFTQALREAALHKRAYEGELHRAFEGNEFEVFYQPQVRLSDGALVGAEALLRWRHPTDGLLFPANFLPALETSLLAAQVGDWVLEKACAQTTQWRNATAPGFRIGVNLFGAQFRTGDLAQKVRAILARTNLDPSALELEITENIILRHDEAMIGPLRELRADGVGITFDDYGTGYASLSLLKRYPLTRLKIDRSFVQGMCGSPEDASIIRAILHLGKGFGLAVIAEGVETEEQRARLRKKGCEEAQGYLFGKPMPASEFELRFGLDGGLLNLDKVTRESSPQTTSNRFNPSYQLGHP